MNKSKLPSAEEGAYKGDVTPEVAWNILESEPRASLVDVRTDAEMLYVGMPVLDTLGKDVNVAPWVLFPGGDANPEFIVQLNTAVSDTEGHVFFLCRSGIRSRFAAELATKIGYKSCYNIIEGFEGEMNGAGHRGLVNGWKVAGLPWKQG